MKSESRTIWPLIMADIVCSLLIGCVDSKYDLSKDINMDMSFGSEGIGIPIGNTEPIYLTELIDTTDNVLSIADGLFMVKKSGNVKETSIPIDPVSIHIKASTIDPIYVDFVLPSPSGIKPKAPILYPTITTNFESNTTISVHEEVPLELKMIQSATVLNGTQPKLHIRIDFSPVFINRVPEIEFQNFKVTFPSFLKFAPGQVENNVMTVNTTIKTANGYNRDLILADFDFSDYDNGKGLCAEMNNSQNYINLNKDNEVSYSGTIIAKDVTVGLDLLQNLMIQPSITVDAFSLGEVKGKVDPKIDAISENVSLELNDDLDFLQNDASLDLTNPQIKLHIANTVGVPLDLNLMIYGKNKVGTMISGSMISDINVKVKAAQTNGQPTYTDILISRKELSLPGYESVVVPNLSNLLDVIPNEVCLTIDSKTYQQAIHVIDLNTGLKKAVWGKYEVNVPFEFESLKLNYTETVNDLHSDLKDISENQGDVVLELKADVCNSIPVDLALSIAGKDIDGDFLNGISSSECIIAAGADDKETVTPIDLKITAKKGTLPVLDQLDLYISGVVEQNGKTVKLKESQYVVLKNIKLKILGPLTFDVNK